MKPNTLLLQVGRFSNGCQSPWLRCKPKRVSCLEQNAYWCHDTQSNGSQSQVAWWSLHYLNPHPWNFFWYMIMIIFMLIMLELRVQSQGVSGDSWQPGSLNVESGFQNSIWVGINAHKLVSSRCGFCFYGLIKAKASKHGRNKLWIGLNCFFTIFITFELLFPLF